MLERLSASELLNLSVEELAQKFGFCRRHLNRLFHQYFGLSVSRLRMEMRMLKAVTLLRDPNAKVINVAEECGFNHLGLFNASFKQPVWHQPGTVAQSRQGNRAGTGRLQLEPPASARCGPRASAPSVAGRMQAPANPAGATAEKVTAVRAAPRASSRPKREAPRKERTSLPLWDA